jgi:hypothetical protein
MVSLRGLLTLEIWVRRPDFNPTPQVLISASARFIEFAVMSSKFAVGLSEVACPAGFKRFNHRLGSLMHPAFIQTR